MSSLASIGWLRDLPYEQWEALKSRTSRHEFAERETIFAPTPDPHSVYLLEQGRVRILRISQGGEEVTLGYVADHEVFGELPGFGDHARESYAIARTRAIVWKIPLDLFRELVATRPKVAAEITRQMGDRMKRVEARVESLVFGDVRSRVATVLLELAEDFGRDESDRRVIDLQIPQGELATLIGSTRQSVNSVLAALRDEGLVRVANGRTEILDPERLKRIAHPAGP